jgi:hypothetical protein
MGMTYDEVGSVRRTRINDLLTQLQLTVFGRLRKVDKLGPYGMFQRLAHEWGPNRPKSSSEDHPVYTPRQVAEKVKVREQWILIPSILCHISNSLSDSITTMASHSV